MNSDKNTPPEQNDGGTVIPPVTGDKVPDDGMESLGIAGLEFEPSLPDPLRYTGANFRTLGDNDLIPQDAWKSKNKDNAFEFEATKTFDGSLKLSKENTISANSPDGSVLPGTDTSPDTSFSIIAKPSKLPSNADDVVKTNYKVKLNLNFDPIAPINRSFKVNIELEGFDAITSQLKTIEQKLDVENIESDFELEDLDDIAKIKSVGVILTPSEPPASDSDTPVFVDNPVLSLESIEIAKKDRQSGSFEPFANIQEIGEFQQNGVSGFKGTLSDPDFPFQGDGTIYRIIFNFSHDQRGVSDDKSTSDSDDKSTSDSDDKSTRRVLEVNLFPKLEEQDLITKKFTDVADKAVYEFRDTKNLGKIMEVSVQDLTLGDSKTDVPTSGSILKSIEVGKRQDRRGSVFMPFSTFELEMVNQIGGFDSSNDDANDDSGESIVIYTSILSSPKDDVPVPEDEGSSEDLTTPPPTPIDLSEFGFYQQTYDTANFEVLLSDIVVTKSSPPYGLLAREPAASTDSALSGSFCLFVEPGETELTIYTRLNGGKKKNKFKVITSAVKASHQLKISRENGGIFKGYFNGVLIGEETSKSSIDSFNDTLVMKQTQDRPERLGEKKRINSFQLGVVVFAPPPPEKNDDALTVPTPQEAKFSTLPVITLKDRFFSIVEIYNLSLFYGRYGLGRTINTFTLLPGEKTSIELSSTRSSTKESTTTRNVFEKVTDESKTELEKSVEEENASSSEEASAQSASVTASASGGAFGFSFSVSASASTSQSASRSNLAKSVSGAVSNQAAEYSSERTIEANTTTTSQVVDNSANNLKRELENLNNNRTLNFVFRQLNQEFISILHLVNIRIGMFGSDDSVKDAGVDGAKAFIDRFVRKDKVEEVYNQFIRKSRFVDDYEGNRVDVLIKRIAPASDLLFETKNLLEGKEDIDEDDNKNEFGRSEKESTIAFKSTKGKGSLKAEFIIDPDLQPIKDIPGVIIQADRYVVRTEGVATEAILGEGDALDDYGTDLQDVDIKKQKATTRILEAKGDLLLLQKDIMNATDNEGVRIKYLKYFNFLEDGNQRSSINTRSDFDSLFWLWLNKAWTFPAFRVAIAFCFMILISFSLSYTFALPRL